MSIFRAFINKIKSLFNNKPQIKENTILLWEPCSKSHSEILPGFAKYFLDLGYEVSVLTNPINIKNGLFSKFQNDKLFLNNLSQRKIKKYFKNNDLSDVKGVLITTIGKLCDSIHYNDAYEAFNKNANKNKLFFVEHEIKPSVDEGTWNNKLITLRKMNYKNADSIVINPHYYGDIKAKLKNEDFTNFITIGALRAKRKDSHIIVKAVEELHNKGIENFKVTVVGKGTLKDLPKHLRKYFDIKGHLVFDKMYKEIENSDFILTAYDDKNSLHQRYNTTGTSGTFQLVYGFLKPCIIVESFAQINDFNKDNSILYSDIKDYSNAMEYAIKLSQSDYKKMQDNLKSTTDMIYQNSLNNLKELLNG
jgi:hypothetical protein